MKKARLSIAIRKAELTARLKVAEKRLRRLQEDVERDRDRLEAESLTLRFVWHPPESPINRNYVNPLEGYGTRTGHFFGSVVLSMAKGENSSLNQCLTYLVHGDRDVYECFTRHCREAEAIFSRMDGDGTRFDWAKVLFETFREDGSIFEWLEDKHEACRETEIHIAELGDVFECTSMLLNAFADGAKLRQLSLGGRLSDDKVLPHLTSEVARTEGELTASVAAVRGVYEWAVSKVPNADAMTIAQLFGAIQSHPDMRSDFLDRLPDNPETFGTYLRRAGIRRYNKSGSRLRRTSRRSPS